MTPYGLAPLAASPPLVAPAGSAAPLTSIRFPTTRELTALLLGAGWTALYYRSRLRKVEEERLGTLMKKNYPGTRFDHLTRAEAQKMKRELRTNQSLYVFDGREALLATCLIGTFGLVWGYVLAPSPATSTLTPPGR